MLGMPPIRMEGLVCEELCKVRALEMQSFRQEVWKLCTRLPTKR